MAQEQVTLVAVENIPPYAKGDVFTIDKEVAEAALALTHPKHPKDENGKPLSVKVERFDPNNDRHAALLLAQRGKSEDAEPVEGNKTHNDLTPLDVQVRELKDELAKARSERDEAVKAAKAAQIASKEAEDAKKQKTKA